MTGNLPSLSVKKFTLENSLTKKKKKFKIIPGIRLPLEKKTTTNQVDKQIIKIE